MDNDLKEILREVLKEELEPFKKDVDQKFAKIDGRFNEVDQKFAKIDERFDEVDQKFAKIDGRFNEVDQKFAKIDERFDEVDRRLTNIEQAVIRIEKSQPTDIMGLLRHIAKKVDEQELQFRAINKRLFTVETEVERFAKQ